MPYPIQHVARIANPDSFQPDSFREKEVAPGIVLLLAKRKGGNTMEGQAYHFDASRFPPHTAVAWLEEHNIKAMFLDMATGGGAPQEGDMADGDLKGLEFDVELVLPGTWKSLQGEVTITEEMLLSMMRDTNALISAGELEPPAKLGHGEDQSPVAKFFGAFFPKDGWPRLGWAKEVRRVGNSFFVRFTGVSETFAGMVRKGLWKARSAGLKANHIAKDGRKVPLILDHVAWLGADAPAVPVFDILGLEGNPAGQLSKLLGSVVLENGAVMEFSLGSTGDGTGDQAGGPPDQSGSGGTTDGEAAGGAPSDKEPEGKPEDKGMNEEEKAALEAAQKRTKELEAIALRQMEEFIDLRLDQLQADRRLQPKDRDAQKSLLMDLEFDQVKRQLTLLSHGPQYEDNTEQKGDQKEQKKEPDADLKGEAKLISLAERFVTEKRVQTFEDGLILAYKTDPEAAKAYDEAAFPNRGSDRAEV